MFARLTHQVSQQLPQWARRNFPGVRYTMSAMNSFKRRMILQQLAGLVAIYIIAAIGYQMLSPEVGRSISERLITFLFWPTLVLQVLLSVAVIVLPSAAIGNERRNGTWDNLRATDEGVNITLRAHWSAAVFYRQPVMLGAIYFVRVVLLGALLYDLTAFRGDYLNYLTGGTVPEVSGILSVILIALVMTASFLLPITGLGLDAAFGLLVSTFVRQRVFLGLTQIVIVVLRGMITAGFLMLMLWVMDPTSLYSDPVGFAGAVGFGAFGDWGLRFLHGAYLGEMWQRIDYTVLIGIALIVVALLQALLTDGILAWAVRRAQTQE